MGVNIGTDKVGVFRYEVGDSGGNSCEITATRHDRVF
jgi:hypothetical protein